MKNLSIARPVMSGKKVPLFREARVFGGVKMDAYAICSQTIHAFFFVVVCKTAAQVAGLPHIEKRMRASSVWLWYALREHINATQFFKISIQRIKIECIRIPRASLNAHRPNLCHIPSSVVMLLKRVLVKYKDLTELSDESQVNSLLRFHVEVEDLPVFRVNHFAVTNNATAKHFPITGSWCTWFFHGYSFLGLDLARTRPI
jgi:hypothetical protein